jgi:hypothetical protein
MNPFEDSSFLKNIKRCYIIREMIKDINDKDYDIIEGNFKLHNDIITISIKLKNDNNIYRYQYIPKQKQILNINKNQNRKDTDINKILKRIEKMNID